MSEIPSASPPAAQPSRDPDALRSVARQIEGAFLNEMLKHAGVGAPRGAFGGGIGEEQFASLLREAYSGKLVEAGGIGLSESIYRALSRGSSDG